jgi:hypothetical protein
MKRRLTLILTLVMLLVAVLPAQAATPTFGMLFYEGDTVRTLIPPSSNPQEGRDNLYVVTSDAAEGQLGIAAVAPGDQDYHGGHWAFHSVTFNEGVDPYLLKSEADVRDAYDAGDVTVTRIPEMDFKCPIQP